MCNALWECIKCPAKVVCCCVECTCKLLCGIICSFVVVIVVILLILYFTIWSKHDDAKATTESVKNLMAVVTPATFREYFQNAHTQ